MTTPDPWVTWRAEVVATKRNDSVALFEEIEKKVTELFEPAAKPDLALRRPNLPTGRALIEVNSRLKLMLLDSTHWWLRLPELFLDIMVLDPPPSRAMSSDNIITIETSVANYLLLYDAAASTEAHPVRMYGLNVEVPVLRKTLLAKWGVPADKLAVYNRVWENAPNTIKWLGELEATIKAIQVEAASLATAGISNRALELIQPGTWNVRKPATNLVEVKNNVWARATHYANDARHHSSRLARALQGFYLKVLDSRKEELAIGTVLPWLKMLGHAVLTKPDELASIVEKLATPQVLEQARQDMVGTPEQVAMAVMALASPALVKGGEGPQRPEPLPAPAPLPSQPVEPMIPEPSKPVSPKRPAPPPPRPSSPPTSPAPLPSSPPVAPAPRPLVIMPVAPAPKKAEPPRPEPEKKPPRPEPQKKPPPRPSSPVPEVKKPPVPPVDSDEEEEEEVVAAPRPADNKETTIAEDIQESMGLSTLTMAEDAIDAQDDHIVGTDEEAYGKAIVQVLLAADATYRLSMSVAQYLDARKLDTAHTQAVLATAVVLKQGGPGLHWPRTLDWRHELALLPLLTPDRMVMLESTGFDVSGAWVAVARQWVPRPMRKALNLNHGTSTRAHREIALIYSSIQRRAIGLWFHWLGRALIDTGIGRTDEVLRPATAFIPLPVPPAAIADVSGNARQYMIVADAHTEPDSSFGPFLVIDGEHYPLTTTRRRIATHANTDEVNTHLQALDLRIVLDTVKSYRLATDTALHILHVARAEVKLPWHPSLQTLYAALDNGPRRADLFAMVALAMEEDAGMSLTTLRARLERGELSHLYDHDPYA